MIVTTYLTYEEIFTLDQMNEKEFHQQPLWNNSLIQYKQHTLCFYSWQENGVLKVKDTMKENEVGLCTLEEVRSKLGHSPA